MGHFLLIGAALFALYSIAFKGGREEPGAILVTQGKIENLATGFARTWQRPPTAEELDSLLRAYIREEVYYREALKLGLDRDDTIVRRRLQLKLEFVSEDVAAMAEPTEVDLQAFMQAHPDKFRVERRFTFRQVFLSPERHRETLTADAAKLLSELNELAGKADVSTLGDPFLLEHEFDAVPRSEVAKLFGERFAAKLPELTPGRWEGPVLSSYGVHLLWIKESTPGRLPALTEVREAVRREWANARRLEAIETFFQGLLKNYTVTVERPQPAAGGKKVAEMAK